MNFRPTRICGTRVRISQPMPAPTDYLLKWRQGSSAHMLIPRAARVTYASRAMHEYLGLAWAKLRGKT